MKTARMLVILVLALGIASVSPAAVGTWTTKTDMPTVRWELSTSVVDGKIYAIGGAGPFYQALRTVEEYDPATDTWTTKSEMPTARQGLSTSVVNGKIYAMGGYASVSSSYSGAKSVSTVEEYDPATDTWTTKSQMPTARGSHSASVLDGKIYLIAGCTGNPSYPLSNVLTVDVYEPATDTWTQKTQSGNIPRARHAGFTSVVDGKIYVFGGYMGGRRVDEYDPVTHTWIQKADMPTYRIGLSTSELGGKIYAIGGHPGSSPYPGIETVEVYDPATDTWTSAPDMPTGRYCPRTSVVDGKIYAIGGMAGWPSTAFGTVEEYNPNPLVVDFNGDGIVDSADMGIMVDHWHTDYALCDIAPTPFGDGIVDAQDMLVLTEYVMGRKVDVEADITAIEEVLNQYAVAVNTGDFELWLSLNTDDVVKMAPDAPATIGIEELRASNQPIFDNFTLVMTLFPEEAQVDGNLGFARGNYIFFLTPKTGGESIYMEGKYLTIFKRQADGSWKISHDCFNSNLPPAQ